MRLLLVAGTRPEAIKLAPLMRAGAQRPALSLGLLATGQHAALFDDSIVPFGVKPDHNLCLLEPGESFADARDRMVEAIAGFLEVRAPDLVLVQGDTTSALAAALAARRLSIPVGHVEAGLRSGNAMLPWPEEANRIAIDSVSDLLFAPSEHAALNLVREQVPGRITVTGNTGIDALFSISEARVGRAPSDGKTRHILVTAHRRESIGPGIAGICAAVHALAARGDVRIVWPLHPNPLVRSGVERALAGVGNISLIPALAYPDLIALIEQCDLILSDSGGLQEEAPAIGVPLLVLRDITERPEVIASGNARLVGTDPERILAEAERLLDDPAAHAAMAVPAFPYGRGDASDHILDAIEAWRGQIVAEHRCDFVPPPRAS